MKSRFRKHATAAAAFLALAMASGAQAASYAVSIDRLDNFQILAGSGDQGTLSFTSGTRSATGSETFQGFGGQVGSASTSPPAETTYSLLCSGPDCPVGVGTVAPTPGSTPGPAPLALDPATGYARATGGLSALNFSRADSYAAGNVLAAGSTVRSLAENNRTLPGAATADAGVSLTGNLFMTVGTTQTLTFTFLGSRDLGVEVTAPGGTANASIRDQFNVQCISGTSPSGICSGDEILFQFTPNGAAGGNNVNGTGEIDPFSLNTTIGAANVGDSTNLVDGPATFSLTSSISFLPGTYLVNLSKFSHADIFVANSVPEPSSLILVGSALVGLGWRRGKRNQLKA